MNDTQKVQWKRLAAEATAIIISILLAFAIDAWWEDRGERAAEQLLLKRLRADFIDIQAAIRFVEEEHLEASAACVALMNFPAGQPLPASPEVDRMVAIVFLTSRTLNPGSGAVAVFLGSEGAQLVHNQPLADLLLAWSGLLEEVQEEDVSLQKGVAERWIPFLELRVSLGPYMTSYGDLMSDLPDHVAYPASRQPLIVDQAFINNVLDRYKLQQIVLRDLKPLQAAADRILALLGNEIRDQNNAG
jgi:hypothetical protein